MTTDPRWPTPEELVLASINELKENDRTLHKELELIRIDVAIIKEKDKGNYKLRAFLGGLLPALGVAVYHLLTR